MERLHGEILKGNLKIKGGKTLSNNIYYEGDLFYAPSEFMPEKIDGLFCMVASREDETYLIADKLGTRTIYYTVNDEVDTIYFSAYIKDLLNITDREVDPVAVSEYLTFRTSLKNRTLFKSIRQIPGGCYLRVSSEGFRLEKYWSIPYPEVKNISLSKAVSLFEDLLKEIVLKNVGSSKKVALLLSGGIDSTVLAVALSELNINFTAYTAHFSEEKYDELKFAEMVTDHLGVDHKVIYCTPEKYFQWLKELTRAKCLPVGQINEPIIYGILKNVKEDPVFFGTAADELFGGYTRIFSSSFLYEKNIKEDTVNARYGHIAKRYGYFSFDEKKAILKFVTDSLETIKDQITIREDLFNNLTRIFLYYHSPALIQRIRAACEATGHSFRLPFADPKMIEFALSLPRRYKMWWKDDKAYELFIKKDIHSDKVMENLLQSKIILRKSFNNFVEKVLPERRKMGFPVPLNEWFSKDPTLYEPLVSSCGTSKVFNDIFNSRGVLELINKRRLEDWGRKVFMLLSFCLWLKECVEK